MKQKQKLISIETDLLSKQLKLNKDRKELMIAVQQEMLQMWYSTDSWHAGSELLRQSSPQILSATFFVSPVHLQFPPKKILHVWESEPLMSCRGTLH